MLWDSVLITTFLKQMSEDEKENIDKVALYPLLQRNKVESYAFLLD